MTLAGMNEYEAARLAALHLGLWFAGAAAAAAVGSAVAAGIAAWGIWRFGKAMERANERRANAEQNRHEEAMTALAQAAEDRKAMQAQMAQAAAQAAEDRKDAQAAAAESQKVTNGLLAALERQGAALEKLIDRTDAVVVELQRHQGPGTRPRRRA